MTRKYELQNGTTVEVTPDGRGRNYVSITDGNTHRDEFNDYEPNEIQVGNSDLAILGALLTKLALEAVEPF